MNDNGDLSRMKDELEKCRMMIRHAGNAIFGIDPESGRIVEANIKAEEMTGFTGAELTGLKIWELHPGAEKEQARVLFERVVSAQGDCWRLIRTVPIKLPANTRDGYIRPRIYLLRRR